MMTVEWPISEPSYELDSGLCELWFQYNDLGHNVKPNLSSVHKREELLKV
jgi:hypothetical protein